MNPPFFLLPGKSKVNLDYLSAETFEEDDE